MTNWGLWIGGFLIGVAVGIAAEKAMAYVASGPKYFTADGKPKDLEGQ